MKNIKLKTISKKILGDQFTPINLLMRLRDDFKEIALLESNDFRSKEDCHSFIGLEIISELKVINKQYSILYPNKTRIESTIDADMEFALIVNDYLSSIQCEGTNIAANGLMGHTNFEAIELFENIQFNQSKDKADIPDVRYSLFRFIIAFDHFTDKITLIENIPEGENPQLPKLELLLKKPVPQNYGFKREGTGSSNMTDDHFKSLVLKGKRHCKLGDVFQVVISRRYEQAFYGDDLNVYRALRSLNPSPYLFYFDYGDYKLFGSSPEAQLTVNGDLATLNPIAGTFRRGESKVEDAKKATKLFEDPKENSEHIMLVDLARNDLSINCEKVWVDQLKDIQFFSHVIHLVSKVKGKIKQGKTAFEIYANTFPAGTLSGAPKYRALEIIDANEPTARSFYGGSIGMLQLNGDILQAILIRSFLSKDNKLYSQAGAGIVINSSEENELQEINNKLGALNQALVNAENL